MMERTLPRPLDFRWLAFIILVGWAALSIAAVVVNWTLIDTRVYHAAAERLLAGEPLYIANQDPNLAYRYAPWFAFAWIPLAVLPRDVADALWALALLAGTGIALWPLVTGVMAAKALALLLGPFLLWTAAWGNVHPLMIAALVLWPRSPVVVGISASLKITPILYAAAWWGDWRRIGAAVGIAAVLWAPLLLWGIEAYPTDPGESWISGPLWTHALGTGALMAMIPWAGRYRPLVASLAVLVALPRLHLYDLTLLLPATPDTRSSS